MARKKDDFAGIDDPNILHEEIIMPSTIENIDSSLFEFVNDNSIVISETLDFELQKYLGDILSDYTEKEKFVEFCDSVLTIYPMKGMLYPLVRVLEELEQRDIALSKVEKWLEKNPNDEAIIKLYDYLIEMKSIQ